MSHPDTIPLKPFEMLQRLKDDKVFEGHKLGEECMKEMELLFTYLDSMNVLDKFSFDPLSQKRFES